MKCLIEKIDSVLCKFLGLSNKTVTPVFFKLKANNPTIFTSDFLSGTPSQKSWPDFVKYELEHVDKTHLKKLGVAMGKAIANDLVLSFEDVHLELD